MNAVDGCLQRFAALLFGIRLDFKTFGAMFSALCLAFLLFGKAQAFALLAAVFQTERLCHMLRAPQIRLFRAADPAPGTATPEERTLDLRMLFVRQGVVFRLVEMQLQLAGFAVVNVIAIHVLHPFLI